MPKIPRILSIGMTAALFGCATAENPPVDRSRVVQHGQALPSDGSPVDTSRIYQRDEVSVEPVPTFRVPPRYPKALMRQGITGEAMVAFTVMPDGTVSDATIVRATQEEFGIATREALLHWKFRPATLRGVPVACRIDQPMSFNLSAD